MFKKKKLESNETEEAESPEVPQPIKKQEVGKTLVVKEIPMQPVKFLVDEKGIEYPVISVEDALTEMFNDIKEMKKALA